MAYDRSHLQMCGSFNIIEKGVLFRTLDEIEAGTGSLVPTAAPTALTDNSGGTADDTVAAVPAATAAVTDTTAASLTSTNTALTAIKNDIADLTAKINALRTTLLSSGILT